MPGSCCISAVDQALSRLARSGRLMRICQGIYMQPVETRFGRCAPGVDKGIEALAAMWGETIVPCGGAAAHVLGLTTQVPVRSVYLISGPDRRLRFGSLEVELRHAPRWQLTAPRRRAGDVIRALAWPRRGPRGVTNCSAVSSAAGGERLSRHWHDVARLDAAGYAGNALADRALSLSVARHKAAFFREKDVTGEWINYENAVSGGLQLVPDGFTRDALAED